MAYWMIACSAYSYIVIHGLNVRICRCPGGWGAVAPDVSAEAACAPLHKALPRKRLARWVRLRQLHGAREPPHCQGMMDLTDLASLAPNPLPPFPAQLRLAVAAYLTRSTGPPAPHRIRPALLPGLIRRTRPGPLAAQRPHLGLYVRWMQEIRRFKPSTVPRRFSVTAGF